MIWRRAYEFLNEWMNYFSGFEWFALKCFMAILWMGQAHIKLDVVYGFNALMN